MPGSQKLETTPNFIRLPCLETLNLECCYSLEEVHVSIGSLASLVHLNLRGCTDLRSLPDSICSLRALEVLTIEDCGRLKALPTELGSIESLKMLNAQGLSVSKLPDSIGRLRNLVKLSLSRSKNLKTLPDSICNLRSLEILDISECEKLEELPDQLGMITCLRELNLLGDTMLKDLELYGYDNLLSISGRIEAENCTSKKIPDLSSLKHLEWLGLTNCEALKEIQGLKELTSLRELHLEGCHSSSLACTLTKPFFEILSGFGHKVQIYIGRKEFAYWYHQPCEFGFVRYCLDRQPSEFGFVRYCLDLGIQLEFGPNESHNFLAIILVFEDTHCGFYSVKNVTSGFIWSEYLVDYGDSSLIVILPSSILSIRDGDDRIEITQDRDTLVSGIHLLYKTEIPSEYCCTTDNVDDERSNPSLHSDLESNRKWLFLGSTSTTVNGGEHRSNPADNDLESNNTTVNVEEERSYPFKRLKHSEYDSNWLSL